MGNLMDVWKEIHDLQQKNLYHGLSKVEQGKLKELQDESDRLVHGTAVAGIIGVGSGQVAA